MEAKNCTISVLGTMVLVEFGKDASIPSAKELIELAEKNDIDEIVLSKMDDDYQIGRWEYRKVDNGEWWFIR